MGRSLSAALRKASWVLVGELSSNLGARGSNPIKREPGGIPTAGGASPPTQGEIPRLLFGSEKEKLRPFCPFVKKGNEGCIFLFGAEKHFFPQKTFVTLFRFSESALTSFFCVFAEGIRHALSFFSRKGIDE